MGGAFVRPKVFQIIYTTKFQAMCKNLNFWSVTSVGRLLTFLFISITGGLVI
jgi:hypothetical protein